MFKSIVQLATKFQSFSISSSGWNVSRLLTTSSVLAKNDFAFPQFQNLPPVHKVAGKCSSYATKIERKRTVIDPSVPDFVHIEPLKWATWRMLRDVRRRHIFQRYYPERSFLHNIQKCRMLPMSVREIAYEQETRKLPRDSTYQHLRNRCALTGRSRGLVKRFRLSRLSFRNLADYNKLYGVRKACW